MPSAAKKKRPVAPIAPAPPPAPEPQQAPAPSAINLPVVYDRLEIEERSTAVEKGPLDAAWWKRALKWETELEYQARKVAEDTAAGKTPTPKPEHYLYGDGVEVKDGRGGKYIQPVHCTNVAGEKVICWANANNRSFDKEWCEELVHTILYGQWAGPFTIDSSYDGLPATVNGETVRISRYGRIISGQHEGSACILAQEQMDKDRAAGMDIPTDPKYPVWKTHGKVFVEAIVVKGVTEDPRVLMTVDYVKPRTVADVFYTSPVFKDSTPPQKKELCRILASATDVAWTRTAAQGYRTHPEIVGFLERHKKLLKCVQHIHGNNGNRQLTYLRLQSGTCAALMYLMGCSATPKDTPNVFDANAYRNASPPTEKDLDWTLWEKAEEFWTLLASGTDFDPVRRALSLLLSSTVASEDNQGQGGRGPEKLAILAHAWERWKDHPAGAAAPFDLDDLKHGGLLCLSYNDLDEKGDKLPLLKDGRQQLSLLDVADFEGIDCPPKTGAGDFPDRPMASPEEMAEITRAAAARHARGE